MSRRFLMTTALMGLFAATPLAAQAQETPPAPPQGGENRGDRGDRGDRGGDRGNFDPAQFRERMETQMKERLAVNDEEWKVIQPKMEKVMEARRETGGGFGGGRGFGGPGGDRGRGGDDANRQRGAVETASRELRDLLENKDATAEQITAKLTALREAREKAKANLTTAQKELKDVLTQRQEAVFVTMGMLE